MTLITPHIPSADPPFSAAHSIGNRAEASIETHDTVSPPPAAGSGSLPQDGGATDWEAELFAAQPAAVQAEAGDPAPEPPIPADAHGSERAADPIGTDAPVDERSPAFDVNPSADTTTATNVAPSIEQATEPLATGAPEPSGVPLAPLELDRVDPAPAAGAPSGKSGRRKRQQQKSARARKDKLRSTTAKPEIVPPAAAPVAPSAPAQAPAVSSTRSGWLIPPEKPGKFEGNAPELIAATFQPHAPQMPPPAPAPAPQAVVSDPAADDAVPARARISRAHDSECADAALRNGRAARTCGTAGRDEAARRRTGHARASRAAHLAEGQGRTAGGLHPDAADTASRPRGQVAAGAGGATALRSRLARDPRQLRRRVASR